MLNKTAEQRIEGAKVALLRDPYWQHMAGIFLLGKTTISETCPTAYTDGRNVTYGRKYIDSLTPPQVRATVLHEAFHIMYRHLFVWQHLWRDNPHGANAACDYVINLQIKDGPGTDIPDGWLLDERFRGMDAKQVFDILKQESKGGKGAKGAGKDDGGTAQGHDDHGWDEAKNWSKAEKEKLQKAVDHALREGAIMAGRLGKKLPRGVQDLLQPKINWRDVLREFVKTTTQGNSYATWRRPNRRHLHGDVYLPSTISEAAGHIVLAADTSGSVSGPALSAMVSEVVGVCDIVNPELVDLLYWDAEVAGHERYEGSKSADLAQSTQPKGGGGTNVAVAFDYVRQHNWKPQCMIVLTDGYTPYPSHAPEYPVLWVMTTDNIAPWGTTIRLEL